MSLRYFNSPQYFWAALQPPSLHPQMYQPRRVPNIVPATCFPLTPTSLCLPLHHPPAHPGPTDRCVGQENRSHLSMGSAVSVLLRRLCSACTSRPAPALEVTQHRKTYSHQCASAGESTASPALCFGFRLKPAPFQFQELVHDRPAPPAACDCQCPTDWLTPPNSAS